MSGCIEHTETLSYIIKLARLKQQSLFIVLLDYKNAIGEVNQNLIMEVMKMHHASDKFVKLIRSLCTGCKIFALISGSQTSPIYVRCGVFQTNNLSLLVFNLPINTLINIIRKEKFNCLGFVYNACLVNKYWLQFAKETVLVTEFLN